MDKNEKMRRMHRDLTDMAVRLDKYGNLSELFSMLHDHDSVWGRGVLFGMVRSKLENAELLLKSAAFHLEYHLNEAKKREAAEAVEGDGA